MGCLSTIGSFCNSPSAATSNPCAASTAELQPLGDQFQCSVPPETLEMSLGKNANDSRVERVAYLKGARFSGEPEDPGSAARLGN